MLESPEMEGKKEEAKGMAKERAMQVRSRTRGMFESKKEQLAERMGTIAHAIRQSSEDLRSKDEDTAAKYTEMAARQTENLAEYLRSQDFDEFTGKMREFARRRPEVFLGGAVALGFMLSRFLKSSGSEYSSGEEAYERSESSQGRTTGYQAEPAFRATPSGLGTDQPL
ncbi:MAG: hypothetical protein ACOC0U_04615 [Desulfovibrionales bacterium]